MSQTSEELLRSFFVRCSDVGLNCDCIIFGKSEEKVMDAMIIHMYEYHAIFPEEMTTCMRLKIRENTWLFRRGPKDVRLDCNCVIPSLPSPYDVPGLCNAQYVHQVSVTSRLPVPEIETSNLGVPFSTDNTRWHVILPLLSKRSYPNILNFY